MLRINAKETLCPFQGRSIEGWEEEGRNAFNSYPDNVKKPLSHGEGQRGEAGGTWRGKEKKTKKACFAVLVNH